MTTNDDPGRISLADVLARALTCWRFALFVALVVGAAEISWLVQRDPYMVRAVVEIGTVVGVDMDRPNVPRVDPVEKADSVERFVVDAVLERGSEPLRNACRVRGVNVSRAALEVRCSGRTEAEAKARIETIFEAIEQRHAPFYGMADMLAASDVARATSRIARIESRIKAFGASADVRGTEGVLLRDRLDALEDQRAALLESMRRNEELRQWFSRTRIGADGLVVTARIPNPRTWLLAAGVALVAGALGAFLLGLGMRLRAGTD